MNRRIALWTLAAIGGASTVMVAGCGDDSTPSQTDSGGDGAPDATTGAMLDSSRDQTVDVDAGATGDQTLADAGADSEADATDGAAQTASDAASEAGDSAACGQFDAAGLDDASVRAGMLAVWTVYRCQGCHQKTSQKVDDAGAGIVLSGNNDGIGDSGMVFPPNLTGDPATGLGCWTDAQILNAILHGKHSDGTPLCPSMPKWGNALFAADGGPRPGTPMDAGTAQNIVDFLRSLPPVNNKVMSTRCPMPQDAGDTSDAGGLDASDGNPSDGSSDGSPSAEADARVGATE